MQDTDVLASIGCLVRYGRLGWVGLFTAPVGVVAERGDRVVVRTPRGLELGETLSAAGETHVGEATAGGEIIRVATEEDRSARVHVPGELDELLNLVRECDERLEPVDAEILLDGRTAIVYCLGDVGAGSERVAIDLSTRTGHDVRLSPVFDPPPRGCGSGEGCGNGGCGTGGELP
ncbi:MAG: hypothetical protein CMJ65_04330 [Planctomycetaceae bacterium]|nr:hypothetical protein [Planctomycetaceae bacterium]MDP7276499.1 hypothetical protein [Planctomycetaceae bacterium]